MNKLQKRNEKQNNIEESIKQKNNHKIATETNDYLGNFLDNNALIQLSKEYNLNKHNDNSFMYNEQIEFLKSIVDKAPKLHLEVI
jgi:hypothetical protein